MGYELHITRADAWEDSESDPITLAEWQEFVRNDPQMRLDGFAEAVTTEGERLRVESPGLAVWMAYSRHGVGGNMAWFDHQCGCIVVKSPDDEIVSKMVQIANHMRARVQGDEGEFYPLPPRPTRPRGSAASGAQPVKTSWWSRLLGR